MKFKKSSCTPFKTHLWVVLPWNIWVQTAHAQHLQDGLERIVLPCNLRSCIKEYVRHPWNWAAPPRWSRKHRTSLQFKELHKRICAAPMELSSTSKMVSKASYFPAIQRVALRNICSTHGIEHLQDRLKSIVLPCNSRSCIKKYLQHPWNWAPTGSSQKHGTSLQVRE